MKNLCHTLLRYVSTIIGSLALSCALLMIACIAMMAFCPTEELVNYAGICSMGWGAALVIIAPLAFAIRPVSE
jgi:hypothetical protein